MGGGDIRVWDLETPGSAQTITVIKTGFDPISLSFSPDGSHIVSASHNSIHIWNWRLNQAAATSLQGHADQINTVSYLPDGLHVFSSSRDRTIRIWDVQGSRAVAQPLPEHSDISSIAVSRDGAFIVSGSTDGSLRTWNARTGEPMLQPWFGQKGIVLAVSISPNGRLIASGTDPRLSLSSHDAVVQLWDTQTGNAVTELSTGYNGGVGAVEFSPDGLWLASALVNPSSAPTGYTTVYVWKAERWTPIKLGTLRCTSRRPPITFSPDGRLLAAAAADFGRVHIWQTHTGQPLCTPLLTDEPSVIFLHFPSDGTRIISVADDGTIRVRNINNGQITSKRLPPSIKGTVDWLAYSPNSKFSACMFNETMRLWDAAKPDQPETATLHFNSFGKSVAAFGPKNDLIIVGSRSTIRVWRIEAVFSLWRSSGSHFLAQLLHAGVRADGWVMGQSKENRNPFMEFLSGIKGRSLDQGRFEEPLGPTQDLLLWIPPEYREYVQLPPCPLLIARHRIVITTGGMGLYNGENWTSCWRRDTEAAESLSVMDD